MDAARDLGWRRTVIELWEHGDVVATYDHSPSHGRLPYEGPCNIAVYWA